MEIKLDIWEKIQRDKLATEYINSVNERRTLMEIRKMYAFLIAIVLTSVVMLVM